ncbi:MAG: alpha/beta hydrolase [Pseudonocardia sp.]|nr:alpha/beta hydrolase [Pseudonocardia sp.]
MGRLGGLVAGTAAGVGALGIAAAAGARRPVITRWPVSIGQVAPCLPASEAPGPTAALLAAVGLAALGTRTRLGYLGAVVNAVAAAGVVGLRGDADRSAAVLDDALLQLGGDPGELPPAEPVPTLARRLRRFREAPARWRVAADVPYGDLPVQLLDVWADPATVSNGGRAPVLLQVHGGGWTFGDKAGDARPLMAHLAERGWVCVSIDYRLGPGERWPSMIVDVKRAIAWIREHIAEYGGDPDFVAISGGSAGGHLCALAATTANDPDFQPGFTDADTSVAAAVPFYGVHDLTADENGLFALLEGKVFTTTPTADGRSYRQASPVHRITPGTPPFLVIHGDTDAIASVGQSRRFVSALRRTSGAAVCYAELPRAQHSFDSYPTRRTAYAVDAVHRFLTVLHRRHQSHPTTRVVEPRRA